MINDLDAATLTLDEYQRLAGLEAAGANVFVSGSALFDYPDRTTGIAELRSSARAAQT